MSQDDNKTSSAIKKEFIFTKRMSPVVIVVITSIAIISIIAIFYFAGPFNLSVEKPVDMMEELSFDITLQAPRNDTTTVVFHSKYSLRDLENMQAKELARLSFVMQTIGKWRIGHEDVARFLYELCPKKGLREESLIYSTPVDTAR